MTKVHEEEWEATPSGVLIGLTTTLEAGYGDGLDADRWKLAAAAPDVVRVLLAVEWGDRDWCIVCDALNPATSHIKDPPGHAPDCALDAALRKAGVRG